MVGSFPPAEGGYTNVGELLSRRFSCDHHRVIITSRRRSKISKLIDIVGTLVLRRNEYDVVLVEVFSTFALWYAFLAIRLARRLDKRVVAVLHGGGLPRLAREKPRRLRAVLGPADVVASPSHYLMREVGDALGIPIVVIPNPVEVARFPRRLRRRASPRIFWLRALHEVYRPEVAIRAVALLREDHPDVHLTMAGPPKDGSWEKCRALVRELGLVGAVEFPGLIDQARIGEIGDACDIFLNTSSVDNAPLSIVEALTMGLCVVTTNVGGIPSLVEDGKEALLVSPGAVEETAAAIRRILDQPALVESLSANALASAMRFDIARVASLWYELLGKLLAGEWKPGSPAASFRESSRPA